MQDMQDSHLSDGTFVVVDVETTGLSPAEDRITEIAMMKVKNGVLLDEFSTLINPLVSIPASITNLTGIDNLMVADAPTAREVAPSIAEFLGNAIFVAHNAQFDWGFVSHTTMRERGIEIHNPQLCTVKLSRIILPTLPSKSPIRPGWRHSWSKVARHAAASMRISHPRSIASCPSWRALNPLRRCP